MTSLRIAAWVSGLFLLAVGAAHLAKADVLVTTNGSRFEGLVSQEADRYVVTFPNGGRMKFPKDTVREVIKTDAHETPPPPGPAAPRPTQPSSSPTGADKEAIALRLVGDSLKVLIDARLDLADSEEMKRATQLMQKTLDLLKQKGVADGLREAACNIGRTGHQYRLLTVLVSGRPEIADIKKALGSEDRSQQEGYFEELSGPDKAPAIFPKEEPGKQLKPITWYEYGWLRFGVIEGKVRCIRVDPQEVLTGKKSDDMISISSFDVQREANGYKVLITLLAPLPEDLQRAALRVIFINAQAGLSVKQAVAMSARGDVMITAGGGWSRLGGLLRSGRRDIGFILDLNPLEKWSGPSANQISFMLDSPKPPFDPSATLLPGMVISKGGQLIVQFVKFGKDGNTRVGISNVTSAKIE